ncbi:Protein EMSY, partial [Ophiophagus hannah]
MPVVWPTLLDLSRDECKRVLRKLGKWSLEGKGKILGLKVESRYKVELEAYAGVISALRAQGDLTKEKRDLLGELSRVLSMSGPNSSSEWSIEGRRLVPLMPRLVPQTAFTVTANAVANAALQHNASLPSPAETGSKEVVVCYSYTTTTSTPTSTPVPSGSVATVKSPRPASPASNVVVLPSGSAVYVKSVSCSDEDEKPRKRRRTNSSSSSPVLLKEVPKAIPPVTKTITVPVGGSPKMSSIMQSIANSLPPHMSPVKITFTKPSSTQTTNTTTQKVIIVTTSPSSTFVPNILSKSHNYAAVTKLVPTSVIASTTQKQPVVITASQSALVNNSTSTTTTTSLTAGNCSTPSSTPSTVAVTTVVSSTPSVVMSTVAQAIITATRPITKMIVTQPKGIGSGVQPATKIIPTKIVLIKPKPVTFQATVVSEQARQLVTETLQQASRVVETSNAFLPEVKEEPLVYTDSSSSSVESIQSSQGEQ